MLRAFGNYDYDAASLESSLSCKDKSLAVQSQRDEADINTIVKRFGLTGEIPVLQRVPLPEDVFYDELDYRECLDYIKAADASFATLPADVRSEFDNNPALFVDYCAVPENLPRLRELGLAPAAEVPTAPAVPPAVPPA